MLSNLLKGILPLFLLSQGSFAEDDKTQLETIIVREGQSSSSDPSRIRMVEGINLQSKNIGKQNSFSEAIDGHKGVNAQLSCAFCGSKRVTINGLKGEHTSFLIDNLALSSSVSSFYSVDAIPVRLIESLDVYRGAGAHPSAPEALGGVLSIQLKEPFQNQSNLGFGVSDLGSQTGFLQIERRLNPDHAVIIGGEFNQSVAEDQDQNRVTEVPWLDHQHAYIKSVHQFSEHQFILRWGQSLLGIIGGNPEKNRKRQNFLVPQKEDFVDGDTRKKYIGDPLSITDDISLVRTEAVLQYQYQFDDLIQFKFDYGGSQQKQSSYYSHGYDFSTDDQIQFLQARVLKALSTDQNLQLGLQRKDQNFQSESNQLYQNLGLKQDDSLSKNIAFFLHFEDTPLETLSYELGLRLENFETQWTDLDSQISETVVSPRLALKYLHSSQLTSRWGYGRGYRVPLSLFESQHGTNEHGFTVAIDQLESADSLSYQGLWQSEDSFIELNLQGTVLSRMAYGEEPPVANDPLIFKNSDEDYLITLTDFSFGSRITESLTYEVLAEVFHYPKGYKQKLPVAAIERRLQLRSDFQKENWKFQGQISVIFERNLSDYGYLRNYHQLTGTFPAPEVGVDQKSQTSPTYATVDLSAERQITSVWKGLISVVNLFDMTQTSQRESPLSWELHGNHYHLDNRHLWGQLKGRQFYLQIQGQF